MNPYGEVSLENYGDVVTVNGHSYADVKTDRTNFALLVSTDFTEPFDDPIAYGKSIARLANLLGEDIIVQRLGDLQQGHRTHHGAHPPRHRAAHAAGRDARRPGLRAAVPPPDATSSRCSRRWTSSRRASTAATRCSTASRSSSTRRGPSSTTACRRRSQNLYAVGDGAGITRGLVQASAAGVIAARSILNGGRPAD